MTLTMIPETEADLLAAATGASSDGIRRQMLKLSELERSITELSASIAGVVISDREIARRLGIRVGDVRRTRAIAASKLRHPAFGTH